MDSRIPLLAVTAAALLLGSGCSIFKSSTSQASSESSSDSSKSLSRFVSSPFRWSSGSSGDSGSQDVEQATESFVHSEGDLDAFRRDLSRIGREHGVSDWESHEPTWWAIGQGLRRAGVEGERLEAVKTELADANPHHMKWIQWGYEAE